MKVVVLADHDQQKILATTTNSDELVWAGSFDEFLRSEAEVFIDLLFDGSELRIKALQQLKPSMVIINSVENCLSEIDPGFIRINAWNSFLDKEIIEASGAAILHAKAEAVFSSFHKKLFWLPDQPGFVTPRVISMIINEAFLLLREGGSTKEDIDLAMKLGTNYPYGPFEWCELIGEDKVRALILALDNE